MSLAQLLQRDPSLKFRPWIPLTLKLLLLRGLCHIDRCTWTMRDEMLLVQAWTTRKNTPQDRFAMKSLAEEEGVPQSVFAAFKEVSHRWIPTSLERYLTICLAKQKKVENNTWPVLQGTPLQLWAALLSEPTVAVHCLRILPCLHIGQQGEVQMEAEQSHWKKPSWPSFHHAPWGKTFSALQRWRLRKDVHEPAGRAVSARW